MKVRITEIKTNKIVATYPVEFEGLNYKPQDDEYFELAWASAVEDAIVEAKNKKNYFFGFV